MKRFKDPQFSWYHLPALVKLGNQTSELINSFYQIVGQLIWITAGQELSLDLATMTANIESMAYKKYLNS